MKVLTKGKDARVVSLKVDELIGCRDVVHEWEDQDLWFPALFLCGHSSWVRLSGGVSEQTPAYRALC